MKPASAELEAILASGGPYIFADLYTFSLRNGLTLRYTSGDRDITHGGHLFRSGGEISGHALVTGGRMRCVRGLEVDTTEITIAPGVNDTVNGIPMLKAIRQGQFDRANLLKERAFFADMTSYGDTSPGTLIIFSGEVADATPSRTAAKLTIKSDIYLLNVSMPRAVYQASCSHTLGDTGCGVDRSAYAAASTVLTGSTAVSIVCDLAQAESYFDLGTVAFTSGANAGLSRSVKAYEPGSVTLTAPFPNTPDNGDAFTVLPGCGKIIPTLAHKVVDYVISAPRTVTIANLTEDMGVSLIGISTTVPGYTYEYGDDAGWHTGWMPPVTTKAPDVAMVKVSGAPVAGQYSLSGGTYTFSSANDGRSVKISCQYAADNTEAQCFAIYNNVSRFSGCPHIPVAETAT
jgi:uncharacterized phage protein (TIGR02218 family)